MKKQQIEEYIIAGKLNPLFGELYGGDCGRDQQHRWLNLIRRHASLFGDGDIRLFSTPGRTELGGNHTDHNHGRVLSASVNLDTIAAVSLTGDTEVVIDSEGYPLVAVDTADLAANASEEGSTDALVRGIAAGFQQKGYQTGGFRANTTSGVLKGAGLSSSAALEVLVGTIFNALFNANRVTTTEIARIGQYAENTYFGKPCGLMDQVACANGGIVAIDFKDPSHPEITPVVYNFQRAGYTLMVVNTGGNHADLTPEYAAIPDEMRSVAACLGKETCREISEASLISRLKEIRSQTGDRALLRALHFLDDNARVKNQVQALKDNDMATFLHQVNSSGQSSFCRLQNVYAAKEPREQGIGLALALTQGFLHGRGACRVHGGGFAGTIQVYIPNSRVDDYTHFMNGIFGDGAVTPLRIRPLPSMMILE